MKRLKKHALKIGLVVVALGGVAFFAGDLGRWLVMEPPSHAASQPASLPASQPASHPAHDDEVAHYTCPMHPSVKKPEPGSCPICGMDLTPVTHASLGGSAVVVDAVRRQKIGVRVASVERRTLRRRIRAAAVVAYDETRLKDVNLRTGGWIQKLHVNETGQAVTRGQTMFELYSPELHAAQVEHIGVLSRVAGRTTAFRSLAESSRNRLRLLGLTDGQIAALEKRKEARTTVGVKSPAGGFVVEKNIVEGARVDAGAQVFRIASLDRVWVEASVDERDLRMVHLGQTASVSSPHRPDPIGGTVDFIFPTLDERTRTNRIRIVVVNDDHVLKPNMYVDVEIDAELGERLAIPSSAVLYTGARRIVFVDRGEGRLEPTVVKVGLDADGYREVLSGLALGDVVVTSGNFLIAAESRIGSAEKYWEANDETE